MYKYCVIDHALKIVYYMYYAYVYIHIKYTYHYVCTYVCLTKIMGTTLYNIVI